MTTTILIVLVLLFFFIALILQRKEFLWVNLILASIATVYFIYNAFRSDETFWSIAWIVLALIVVIRGVVMLRNARLEQTTI